MTSCGDKIDEEKLYGQYVFSHWSKDTLDIRPNGTYYYRTYVEDKILKNEGNWKLNSIGTEINFENFSFLTNGLKGNWYSLIRTQDAEIHLMYASEENIYFKKIKD